MNRITGITIELITDCYRQGIIDRPTMQGIIDWLTYEPKPEDDLIAKAVDEALECTEQVKPGEFELLKTGRMRRVKTK